MKRTLIISGLLAAALLGGALAWLNWRADTPAGARLRAVIRPPLHTDPAWTAYVSTLATKLDDPFGVALAGDGTLFVAEGGDSNRILRISPERAATVLAGGREGFADGTGASAAFNTPSALALDRKGNLYVADTGNNAIRRITPAGAVSTIAGGGGPGYADGKGTQARFNGPVGVAVDRKGVVYVADTYNDRIRRIAPDGTVSTIAGTGQPGMNDGPAASAAFDTPTAIAVSKDGTLYVADTGNDAVRKIAADGAVTTFAAAPEHERRPVLRRPLGLALARDGYLYVSSGSGGRILEVAPDGSYHPLLHADPLQSEYGGDGSVRLYGARALALANDGSVIAADALGRHIEHLSSRRLAAPFIAPGAADIPHKNPMPWPVSPQFGDHEVVGLMGEDRGSYDGENRDHFHAGLDVRADVGQAVLAVAASKVIDPLPNWGFGALGEGMSVGALSYIHMRVGRDPRGRALDPRFEVLRGERGKPERVRVRRGTRFAVGDALGTVNAMAHVHLEYYPDGPLVNPLALPFSGISDAVAPRIEGIYLYDSGGERIKPVRGKPLLLARSLGSVQIVVEGYDQMDGNLARRRLGLYKLGYQVLHADGTPVAGYEKPLVTQVYNRLPRNREAVKMLYAPQSGITVYGSKRTRFAYEVTNTLHDGQVAKGSWKIGTLAPGGYLLRAFVADYAGNVASAGRDLPLTVE